MKKFGQVVAICIFILIFGSSYCVFASEEFILKREMSYINEMKTELKKGFVEIMIGQKDFTEYQDDKKITITPAPDEIREDEYGNLYAYYDVTGYKPGRSLNISIERILEANTYLKEISARSEATVTDENELYVESQTRVDCDDSEIIAKANELTRGVSSSYKKALALFEYVNTQMEYTTAKTYANQGSLSALKTKKGVCEEYATLYAALCRAIHIPCKVVEGYRFEKKIVKDSETVFDTTIGEYVLTQPEYAYEIISHVWNEIYLDDYGWTPVDTCVIYAPQGKKLPYKDAFCCMKNVEYVATGIYNYEKANRTMQNMKELSYKESLNAIESETGEKHTFLDLQSYEWATDSIETLYDMEIIKGYTDTEFGPGGKLSRIEFITLLSRVLKSLHYEPSKEGMVYYFMDYDKNHYSKKEYDYLLRCLEMEKPYDKFACGYYVMSSVFGDSLSMNTPITRGEVVALLDYFLKEGENEGDIFTDVAYHRFRTSILKAYSNGLINGYTDGTFRPDGTITRAEIAVILDRYIGVKDYVLAD